MHRRTITSNNSENNNSYNFNSNSANTATTTLTISKSDFKNQAASSMMMSCRDRTSEFQSTIRSFQSRMNNQQLPNQVVTTQKQDLLNQRQQFMLIAKKIGKELTNTCIKLEKLTDLAKKRSLFDDKPKEIQNLTNNIKEDINNLHSEISRLQQLVKANKNVEGKNMQKHSFNVVFTLQSKLANVSKDFKNVLEVRNENLKQQTERGEQFFSKNTLNPSSAASVFAAPKMPGSNNMGKSVLLYDGSSGQSGLNTYNNNPSKQQHGETVLNMDQMQQKQQLQHRLIVNEEDSFLRDRANAMQTVEQTIIELGGMFQQLATMIKEQDEAIQRIDSNVDDVDMNVNEAHSELLKYFQSVTSNRWLMIKIFLVLIVFFVVFIVVI
jgi:syntaxin 5